MCNNVYKWFLRAFAVVAALTVISCADSPDEDDIVIPQCSLSVDGTTVDEGNAATMTFDETGGSKQFSIKTTGEWEITGLENAPQGFALTTSKGEEKYTGKGNETFTVTLGEATTSSQFLMTVKVYASIFGQKKVADTQTITVMQIKGGVQPVGKVIYANNFDKEEATKTYGQSGSSYPYLDQFEGWKNQEGEGAAEVTYDFKGTSVRSNSKSNSQYSNYAGSGSNNIFFGTSAYFTIQNIAVSTTNLCLTFGTERYINGEDNTFKNEEFLVTLSADGQSWSAPITYAFEEGSDTNGKWNVATANFTLPDGTTKLYIKFASTITSAHRIDDVKLTDGIGGQAITFEGGGDEPDQPTPPTPVESGTITMSAADIIANGTTTIPEGKYGSQNVDDVSTYYTWTMNEVTFAGAKICKATDEQDALYAGLIQMQGNASDKAKQGFFGNTVDLKKITKVVIVSKNTKYEPAEHLYVGTSAYPLGQNAVTRADLKQEGQTYTETFNISGDYGYFAVANDKQGAFYVESVTIYYGGEGSGDEPTPPTPGTTTVADLVAKCKEVGTTQTVLDAANDVVVEAVVVTDKDGGNTTSKNLAIMAEGATAAGNGVMLYGSGITDPADDSFTWKSGDKVRVTLKAGQARACTYNGTYEITGSANADWIAIEKIGTATVTPVELTSVDKLAEYQSMVVKVKAATSPATAAEWCTADSYKTHTFTVSGSNLTVYVQKNAAAFVGKEFKASTTGDITGVVTVYKNNPQLAPRTADDVKAFNGEGGGDEPTPPTPGTTTVADLVAKCKDAGTTQTVLDAANDVVVEAVVVTDKDGGNTTSKNLAIMAEGATAAGNGVVLYGSGITDPADNSYTWKSGDKVRVTLKAGQARACTYNGMYEITGSANADWIAIEKIGTATVTPVELTSVDKLVEYQSMVVKVKAATSPATAAEWCTASAYKTHTFTVGGSNLTVYVQKNAVAFVGKEFKASTTGDITGVVTVYKSNPQLAPRTADDVKAFNGEGGGDEPTPPTPGTTTVADLVAKCKEVGTTQTVLDAANDVVVEAVVVTDKDGGNTTSKNLAIMAEGATAAGNGVVLYGSGITDPADNSYTWKSGDKVRVTLKAGQARACTYNGMYEITGSANADWVAIEKIGTATVTPVELTSVDKLAEYQSMVVKVKAATSPATAAEWCTASAYKTHTFTVGGSNLTVYVQKNAVAFVGKEFKASTTGDITGVVTVYKSNPQLAPRTADDVKAFNGEGGGDQPTPPTPVEGSVAKYVPSGMGYANAEKVTSVSLNDGAVTLAFAGGGTATAYYDSGSSLRCYGGSTITVKSDSKISKIVIARGTGDKGNTLAASAGTLSSDTLTWTGDSNEVVLTVSGTSGHIRIKSMEITYGGSSSK